MNNEIKVSLTVILPGRVMLSQKQAEASEKQTLGSGFDHFSMEVSELDKVNKKFNREVIQVETRKSVPSSQALNITVDVYETMIDSSNCPYSLKHNVWQSMTIKGRLEYNLQKTCEYLGGVSYSYVVFE